MGGRPDRVAYQAGKSNGSAHSIPRYLTAPQGETVSKDGISVPFKVKIPIGKENDSWPAQIVKSGMKASRLPQSMASSGGEEVWRIQAEIDGNKWHLEK